MRHARATFGVICLLVSIASMLSLYVMRTSSQPPAYPAKEAQDIAPTKENKISEVDWGYWNKVNPHVIGWIDIPELQISLPVAQAPSDAPSHYLNHDAFGRYNIYGCPFLDASCAPKGLASRCALIYAHHMNDGTMFSKLAARPKSGVLRGYLQSSSEIEVIEFSSWKIVDANKVRAQTIFSTWEEFKAWQNREFDMKGNSPITSRTVCLVTCSYGTYKNQRTLVFGRVVALQKTP